MSNENNCCPKIDNCLNPIIEAFKSWSILDTFILGLNAGIILTHSGKVCCPDCINPTGYYYLGGTTPFTALIEGIEEPYPCCINHSLNNTNNALFETAVGENIPCCNTDFSETLSLLTTLEIASTNLIEASSFNNYSGLNIFLEYADLENISNEVIVSFINSIITEGLVIKCDKCEIFIGSVSAFITYNT